MIQKDQTCVNKNFHVHQIANTLVVEHENSLQNNDIRSIDLSTSINHSIKNLTVTKENSYWHKKQQSTTFAMTRDFIRSNIYCYFCNLWRTWLQNSSPQMCMMCNSNSKSAAKQCVPNYNILAIVPTVLIQWEDKCVLNQGRS